METRYDEAEKITIKSMVWNMILTVIKIGAGTLGNSSSLIADGMHSASDIISSIGVLIGNKIAKTPHDAEHNYGHEKAETLVSFLLSMLLIYVSLKIGVEGIKSLFNLSEVKIPTLLPLVVSIISICIKEYQYRITITVAKKINSPSLKADAWHHRSDALSSVAAFIGIGGSLLGFTFLDPLASIAVAFFVASVGLSIFRISANELMDYSIDWEQEEQIRIISRDIDGVKHLKELKSRKHGAMAYLDLIICVDRDLSVFSGHEIAHNLEVHLIKNMDFIKGVTVHIEPCMNCENHYCEDYNNILHKNK